MQHVVMATGNQGKLREFQTLLADLPVELISAHDAGIAEFPPETGATFMENARAKAVFAANATGLPALADDSGLVVDALDGAPGVYSARYGGPDATDEDRYRRVLAELGDTRAAERTARFVAVVVCAFPDGTLVEAEGQVEGTIGDAPRGNNGFGYDPIFIPAGHDRTFGEFRDNDKHAISHRGRAIQALLPRLRSVFGTNDGGTYTARTD